MPARVFLVGLVFAWANQAIADVYSYECDTLPEEAGWTLIQAVCEADEWIEDGQNVQHVPLCQDFPGFGSQFDYTRQIGDLSSVNTWFVEWRFETNGISDEIPWTAPSAFVVSDGNTALYHFTIADDQFRIIANDFSSLHDIEPGIPHTFRVELFGQDLGEFYALYIDGEGLDIGFPVDPLFNPPFEPHVNTRAKSKLVPSTTSWDYIRWGDIPTDGSGDFDSNGEVNSDDLYFFQECLETEAGSWPGCAWADFDFDVDVDCDDWEAFQIAWTGPGDPPVIPQCASGCPVDLDGSNTVDAGDLAQLLGAWGDPGCSGTLPCPPDLNGDDLVNASDLAELLGSWGSCQ